MESGKKNAGEECRHGAASGEVCGVSGGQAGRIAIGDYRRPRRATDDNPKEIAIEAMNDGPGRKFAARLNMNLREDKHWSYGRKVCCGRRVGSGRSSHCASADG